MSWADSSLSHCVQWLGVQSGFPGTSKKENQMKKNIFIKLAAVPAFVAATAGSAMAALPESVSGDVATAKADMLAGIGLVIGAMVAVWGLKKLASKLGWL
jgi:hypothetical protein